MKKIRDLTGVNDTDGNRPVELWKDDEGKFFVVTKAKNGRTKTTVPYTDFVNWMYSREAEEVFFQEKEKDDLALFNQTNRVEEQPKEEDQEEEDVQDVRSV